MTEDDVVVALEALDIPVACVEHGAVFTVQESDALLADMPGVHTKNLFLKDAGGRFWLLTVPATAQVDLKTLPWAIGAKRVSFGKPEDMRRLLAIEPGSVTPLAVANDATNGVTVVLDEQIAEADRVNVHPLRNTATIGLSGADLVRALRAWRHEPLVVRVPVVPD